MVHVPVGKPTQTGLSGLLEPGVRGTLSGRGDTLSLVEIKGGIRRGMFKIYMSKKL